MAPRGELPTPKHGDTVKVHLPGESPWAECVALHDDGTWEGRINNYLIGQMDAKERLDVTRQFFPGSTEPLPSHHDFRQDQVLRFKRFADRDYEIWVPADGAGGHA